MMALLSLLPECPWSHGRWMGWSSRFVRDARLQHTCRVSPQVATSSRKSGIRHIHAFLLCHLGDIAIYGGVCDWRDGRPKSHFFGQRLPNVRPLKGTRAERRQTFRAWNDARDCICANILSLPGQHGPKLKRTAGSDRRRLSWVRSGEAGLHRPGIASKAFRQMPCLKLISPSFGSRTCRTKIYGWSS